MAGLVAFTLLGVASLLTILGPGATAPTELVQPPMRDSQVVAPSTPGLVLHRTPIRSDSIVASSGRDEHTGIAIRVRTTSGRPWASVSGCVHGFGAEWQTLANPTTFVTDSAGRAEVKVTPGPWVVRIALDPEDGRKLRVEPGVTAQLDYVVDPTLVIAGSVVDETRRPLPDVAISVTTLGADSLRLDAARSDAEGRFRLVIVGDECAVVARADGYATAFTHVQVPRTQPDRLATPTLVLLRKETLQGRVTNLRGDPVVGCVVLASRLATQTDDDLPPDAECAVSLVDGSFRIERLAAGPQVVRAQATDHMPWRGSVEVTAGQVANCLIELRPAGAISGRVMSAEGGPVAGAIVVGYSGKDASCRTRSDAAGEFVLAPLSPGLAQLWAYDPLAGWGHVEHEVDDVREVAIRLMVGPPVRGRCVDQDGAMLAEVEIDVSMVDEDHGREFMAGLTARSGDDGWFCVANTAEGAGVRISATKAGFRGDVRRYSASAAGDIEMVLTSSIDDCILAGRVVDPEGRPVGNATVLVHGSSLGGAVGCATAPDGRFAIADLSRGTLDVSLEHEQFALTRIKGVVTIGGHQELGDLTIVRGGRLRVTVATSDGGAPDGSVYMRSADGNTWSRFELLDGAGVSETVPPGEYRVKIAAANFETRSFQCAVHEGTEALLTASLRPGLPIAVSFDLPPSVPAEESLIGSVTRDGQILYQFTLPGGEARKPRTITFLVGEGIYRIEARAGVAEAKTEFRRDALPIDGGEPKLALRLTAP